MLKAEEAYLTRPERIGPIARERLGLAPASPGQYTAPEALSRRLGEERLRLPDGNAQSASRSRSRGGAGAMNLHGRPARGQHGDRAARAVIAGVLALLFVVIVGRSAYVALNGPRRRPRQRRR